MLDEFGPHFVVSFRIFDAVIANPSWSHGVYGTPGYVNANIRVNFYTLIIKYKNLANFNNKKRRFYPQLFL